ncbi:MAG TPA: hypothetical protein PLC42_06150 [Parachlamydiaceae bacterium]|nr:hypothetical protein [Parachlamydiaceae bacterium]
MDQVTSYLPSMEVGNSLSPFKSVILAEAIQKVVDFALYGARFILASGAIVFGLLQLAALNFLIGSAAITLGTAGLIHIIKDLTNVKTGSSQEFAKLDQDLQGAANQAEQQGETIVATQKTAVNIADQTEQIKNVAAEALKKENIQEVKNDLNTIVTIADKQQEDNKQLEQQLTTIAKENIDLCDTIKNAQGHAAQAKEAAANEFQIGSYLTGGVAVVACAVTGPVGGVIAAAVTPTFVRAIYSKSTENQEETLDFDGMYGIYIPMEKQINETETKIEDKEENELGYADLQNEYIESIELDTLVSVVVNCTGIADFFGFGSAETETQAEITQNGKDAWSTDYILM